MAIDNELDQMLEWSTSGGTPFMDVLDFFPGLGDLSVGGVPLYTIYSTPSVPPAESGFTFTPQHAAAVDQFVDNLNYNTTTKAVTDDQGRVIVDPQNSQAFLDKLREVEVLNAQAADQRMTANPAMQSTLYAKVGSALQGASNYLTDKSVLGPLLGTLVLGGVGLGVSRAVTGGPGTFTPPTSGSTAPPPAVQNARDALNRALTQPSIQSGTPTTAPGAGMLPLMSSGTANLEDALRASLAGQSVLANDTALSASREYAANQEQAPIERAIRLWALQSLPSMVAGNQPPTPVANMLNMTQQPGGTWTADGYNQGEGMSGPQYTGPSSQARQGYVDPSTGSWVQTGTGQPPMATPASNAARYSQGVAAALDPNNPQVPRINDPIRMGLANEIARVLAGQYANPAEDRLAREEEEALKNRLFRLHGAGYEATTGGDASLQRFNESQFIRRENDRKSTLASLVPMEQTRRAAEYSTPLAALSTLGAGEMDRSRFGEDVRQRGLAERLALLNMGRTSRPELSTTLSSIVPIQPLLNLGGAEAAAERREALNTQSALEAFRAREASRNQLASGIAGIFGTAAGALTRPSSNITVHTTGGG